jgi:hypothetical protein
MFFGAVRHSGGEGRVCLGLGVAQLGFLFPPNGALEFVLFWWSVGCKSIQILVHSFKSVLNAQVVAHTFVSVWRNSWRGRRGMGWCFQMKAVANS